MTKYIKRTKSFIFVCLLLISSFNFVKLFDDIVRLTCDLYLYLSELSLLLAVIFVCFACMMFVPLCVASQDGWDDKRGFLMNGLQI